jgi:hypothetical protein
MAAESSKCPNPAYLELRIFVSTISKSHDEFYYRQVFPNGDQEVRPMPAEYVLPEEGHGGFGAVDTGGRGPGVFLVYLFRAAGN